MQKYAYYAYQRDNPARKPNWRWRRAEELVAAGMSFSSKRDDRATGIAVGYHRELRDAGTLLRRNRIVTRYRFLVAAQSIWEEYGHQRLEIETRILARQDDTAIAYEMGIAPPVIQAYRDLFFQVDDRVNAASYIIFHVIGLRALELPSTLQLMQLSAYHHGPEVIEPWFRYLRDGAMQRDSSTPEGRMDAQIALFVAAQKIGAGEGERDKMTKILPLILKMGDKFIQSQSAKRGFAKSVTAVMALLKLPSATLTPFSYAPEAKGGDKPYKPFYSRSEKLVA